MIAYDLETTRIKKGTPSPLYITAYGAGFSVSAAINSLEDLRNIMVREFLTEANNNVRFIAWNGNNFDVFFIGAALLHAPQFILRPYLTRSKALRGLRVTLRTLEGEPKQSWEFLDGVSMIVGSNPIPLRKFLKTFAPDYEKLQGPDFDQEEFDPKNPQHVAYAFRDSEGLWHALQKAESIIQEHFQQGLQPTIGNLGIRIFQAHMPMDATVWAPSFELGEIIRNFVMRGGYCFAARHYEGPVWKYDLNQAYAAAMRDAWLPGGRATGCRTINPYARAAIYRITARKRSNKVPFYVRVADGGGLFALGEMADVWVTSIELEQLQTEGWSIQVHEGYFWEDVFRMHELVNKLEALRMADPDGPSGAQGSMMKATGNNSYGKTVEELDGLDLVMSAERPGEDYFMYQDDSDVIKHIWAKLGEPQSKEYHQPQLGAFITAHVRMEVRRAILQAPDAWLYSDTDCCFFDRPVPLPVDPKKYGKWKLETAGESFRVITKKVYCSVEPHPDDPTRPKEAKAKGINVKRLKMDEFEAWFKGVPPKQTQTQRQNFLAVMTGAEMFVERVKVGQKTKKEGPAVVRPGP